jgi:heat shock protein HslJ
MKKFGVLIMAVLITSAISCKSEDSMVPPNQSNIIADSELEGLWKLKYFEDKKDVVYDVNIEFKKSENDGLIVVGQSSVNSYFAAYQVNKDTSELKISSVGSTKKGGSKEEMQFERNYFRRLEKVTSYIILNNALLLKENDKSNIYFEKIN